MTSKVAFLWGLLMLCLHHSVSHSCTRRWSPSCAPCECSCRKVPEIGRTRYKHVSCSGLNLTEIPKKLPSFTDFLDLSSNQLDVLSKNTLDRFRFLKGLRLANNNVSGTREEVFHNLTSLQYLDITGNKFSTVSENVFKHTKLSTILGLDVQHIPRKLFWGLSPLRTLKLTAHDDVIPDDLFKDLGLQQAFLTFTEAQTLGRSMFSSCNKSLSNLHLEGPRLTSLHEDLLKPLALLHIIKIKTSNMATLPESIFNEQWINNQTLRFGQSENGDLRRLKEISIVGVRSLPTTIFHALPFLQSLTIHKLSSSLSPTALQRLTSLTSLNLSGNNLTMLQSSWFGDLSRLKSLNLSVNDLQVLHHGELDELHSLDYLDLSHNQISAIDAEYFSSFRMELDGLNLSHNSLCGLPKDIFKEMYDLKVLRLNNNCLRNISVDLFDGLTTMQVLHLENNNLVSLDYEHLDSLSDLVLLDLSNNLINHIGDYAFTDLSSLKDMDLSNNSIRQLPSGRLDAFLDVTLLENIRLDGNPLHCDCGLDTLLYLFESLNLELEGTCTEPTDLAGLDIRDLERDEVCPRSGTDNNGEDEGCEGCGGSLLDTPPSQHMETSANVKSTAQSLTTITTNDVYTESVDVYTDTTVGNWQPPTTWRDWFSVTTHGGGKVEPALEGSKSSDTPMWLNASLGGLGGLGLAGLIVFVLKKLRIEPWKSLGGSYVVNSR